MLQVLMSKNGYKAVDQAERQLWEEYGFKYLFGFLEADIPDVISDIKSCFDSVIDLETLDVLYDSADTEELDGCRASLYSIHPFLYYNHGCAILGHMLAAHLVELILEHKQEDSTFTKEWFFERMNALLSGAFDDGVIGSYTCPINDDMGNEPTMVDFFEAELDIDMDYNCLDIDSLTDWWYALYQNGGASLRSELSTRSWESLVQLQQRVRREVYWMVDLSAKRFEGIGTTRRAMLYKGIFGAKTEAPDAVIERWASFADRHAFGSHKKQQASIAINLHDHSDYPFDEDDYEDSENAIKRIQTEKGKYDIGDIVLSELENLTNDEQALTDDASEALEYVFKKIEAENAPEVCVEYNITDLYQLLYLQIEQIITNGIIVKRCRMCGRYFTTTDLKIEYCDQIAAGETKPCSEIGSIRAYLKKLDEDKDLNVYNRAYKTHFARWKKGKMTLDEWALWRKDAKIKLDQVRAGELDGDLFRSWLKE